MPPPGPNGVATDSVGHHTGGEAEVFHLIQMKDAFQADHQREDAGQHALSQGTVGVCETVLGVANQLKACGISRKAPAYCV